MLARRRHLRLGARIAGETPLLVPAFSSRGFPDLAYILKLSSEFITSAFLISAYDIYHKNLGDNPDVGFASLVFLDSGHYEKAHFSDLSDLQYSDYRSKKWNRSLLLEVLKHWPVGQNNPVTIAISYDEPGLKLKDQITSAQEIFHNKSGVLKEFLIKPETKKQAYIQINSILDSIDQLAAFDIIGLTEKELGSSVLQRMERIAKIRIAMDRAGVDRPIHIFGGLDTISTPLYYISGAEIFDGLSWLRLSSSIMKCNTWGSRKVPANLSIYGKTI